MTIERVNTNNTTSEKIRLINNMVMELEGLVEKGRFNKNELDDIYTQLADAGYGIDRKFQREVSLGNSLATYSNWAHLKAETGYGIWKYPITNFSDNTSNKLYFDNEELTYQGEAGSESATAFDKVYVYDASAATYDDDTTEAATETGTEFILMETASDYLYVGDASTFSKVKFEFETRASGLSLKAEYWDGSSWTQLSSTTNSFVDNTSNFESDGLVTFTAPDDWATTTVNSQTKYWVRFSTTAVPTTAPKAYYIIPGNSVPGLLALSSEQITNEEWAWCYYDGYVYVTIRNTGNSSYEGNFYITSASSSANLQNFFIYNHSYTADYEDSTYSAASYTRSKSITLEAPTDSENMCLFYMENAITITKINAVLKGSATPSLSWGLKHATTRDASASGEPHEVITGGTTTTSQTSGDEITTFDDATIPAGSWVYLTSSSKSGVVEEINITIFYT